MNRFNRLLHRLSLEEQSPSVFVGGAGEGGVGGEARLFGGLVAAQAVMAAQYTVDDFPMHSFHAYFLRPGRAEEDIVFNVAAMKDGKNFRSRRVEAWQGSDCVFQLISSFQRIEQGVEHQPDMPAGDGPENLPNRDQIKGRSYWEDMPIEVRMGTDVTTNRARPPNQRFWLRVNGELPKDPRLHLALIVYASDRGLLDTAFRPHAHLGSLAGASLDHSMWFHEQPNFDDWLLYETEGPIAKSSRALAMGRIYDTDGTCLVSVAQEGVLRIR